VVAVTVGTVLALWGLKRCGLGPLALVATRPADNSERQAESAQARRYRWTSRCAIGSAGTASSGRWTGCSGPA